MVSLSVVLLVKNEQDRLPDALASVSWASEVVVVDTGSTDGTVEVARAGGTRVVSVPWEGFVRSRNLALAEARHDWVLVLDADERVTAELRAEIERALVEDDGRLSGYRMPRLSTFLGRPIRHGTWYPDLKLRLGRRSRSLAAEGGRVHESLVVEGPVGRLESPLLHHPYRSVSEALRKASTYARLGAEDRYEQGIRGSAAGLVVRPLFEFLRCYVMKAGFLDGTAGLAVALFHASSYFLRAAFLLERERKEPVPRGANKEAIVKGARPSMLALLSLATLLGGCSGEDPIGEAAKEEKRKAKETAREIDAAAKKTSENLEKAQDAAKRTGAAVAAQGQEATPTPVP